MLPTVRPDGLDCVIFQVKLVSAVNMLGLARIALRVFLAVTWLSPAPDAFQASPGLPELSS